MKSALKRILSFVLSAVVVFTACLPLASCGNTDSVSYEDATRLSFKSAASFDYLKSLNNTPVTINGYMATSSPVDGSFIFLMNLPYQSCPFCKPNTSQLSNTLEVYPVNGQKFSYTTQAIRIVGTLVVAAEQTQYFTDPYGYEFNCKIINASYTILKDSDLSADMALWQKIASSDIISDIYSMYDYVNFLCCWNTYFVNTYTNSQGQTVKGYYLYPSDAYHYITTDGAQWNYGYKTGYFDSIIAAIRKIDATAFEDLVQNVEAAKALAAQALTVLGDGKDENNSRYTREYKYLEKFDNNDYYYTITNAAELNDELDRIYSDFADWLGSYEM